MQKMIRQEARRFPSIVMGLLGIILLTAADQFTKYLVVTHLKGQSPIVLISGVFQLTYVENRGAAFGLMQGQKLFFVLITLLIVGAVGYLYCRRIPLTGRFRILRILCVLICAGAVGNLIDRLRYSYVVDFLYFSLIDFPVFNVADCYITVAAVVLMLLLLFYYKEEELDFLPFMGSPSKKADAGEE